MRLCKYVFYHSCRGQSTPLKELCRFNLFKLSTTYTAILGLMGVWLSLYDIYNVIVHGSTLPCHLWRTRMKTVSILSPENERDIRLIGLVMSLEYYFLLVMGSVVRNGTFFIPWMIFYSIIIVIEFALFVARASLKGLQVEQHSLILSIFVIYNWIAVMCAFLKLTGGCK